MTEVSDLKLKLTAGDGDHRDGEVSCTCFMSAVAWQDLGSHSLIVWQSQRSVSAGWSAQSGAAAWTSPTFTKEAWTLLMQLFPARIPTTTRIPPPPQKAARVIASIQLVCYVLAFPDSKSLEEVDWISQNVMFVFLPFLTSVKHHIIKYPIEAALQWILGHILTICSHTSCIIRSVYSWKLTCTALLNIWVLCWWITQNAEQRIIWLKSGLCASPSFYPPHTRTHTTSGFKQ